MGAVPSLFDLTFCGLEKILVTAGLHASHARPLWRALYRGLARTPDFADAPGFLPPLRRWLTENLRPEVGPYTFGVPEQADEISSADGLTRKFLLRLADGQTVETVLMAYSGRFTACLSTQAGLRDGLRVLRDRADGFRAASAPQAKSSRRCSTSNARCERAANPVCATSCSWGWASPCTITRT